MLPALSTHNRMSRIRLARHQNHLPDLAMSPLTASLFQTLEQHYDQDTWRMHNRIAATRMKRTDRRPPDRRQPEQSRTICGNSRLLRHGSSRVSRLNNILTSPDRSAMQEEYDDDEDDNDETAHCIFDLDLDKS